MVIWLVPIVVAVLAALAEWAHARRQKRIAYLAFGAVGKPRPWVAAVPAIRVVAITLLFWGLLVLWQLDGSPWLSQGHQDRAKKNIHHLVIALDVSPSMQIKDAGPKGDISRAQRARDLLRSILERLNQRQTKVSVVAFYGKARPVVVDTNDGEVVDNILDDLPLEQAFAAGKTNMYEGINTAAEIAKTWRRGSATLVLASDGDTLPATAIPRLPSSIFNTLILGVGNPRRGTQIDGHSSRQDTESLRRLALQLRGTYNDGNQRHVRTEDLDRFVASLPVASHGNLELRDWALLAVALSAALLALVSPALAAFGAPAPERASVREERLLTEAVSV